MPSFPVATQTPIENMQAGPAEPQSSSDQLPLAILGKMRTTPSALIFAVASLRSLLFIPAFTGLKASLGALSPATLVANSFSCPDRTKSIHGVQWSTTCRLAGAPAEAGVYFTLTNDSPH